MPRIGTDEWVAEVDGRTEQGRGPAASARRAWDRTPAIWRIVGIVALVALLPLATDSTFTIRVAVNAMLLGLLALGLNVVVGYAGLLDLGFIAFYGFGAYAYSLLSSEHLGVHLPTELTIVLVVIGSAMLGYLLGLPSRRLLGDYLAIVTLFFGQIFVQLAVNLDRVRLPWADEVVNLTGGPNGVVGVDAMRLLGFELVDVTHYFYLLLGAILVVGIGLANLNASRTGRAWRAIREDPLASSVMGMPVNRLKLLAFAFGGAIAGFTGTVFAAVQIGVFPQNFDLTLLVMIYAGVILGGMGSLPGVLIGAGIVAVLPEVLRTPDHARLVFYGVLLLGMAIALRPWRRLASILGGAIVLGLVVRWGAALLWPDAVAGGGEGVVASVIDAWVLRVDQATLIGNLAFVALIVSVVALTRVRGRALDLALVPVIYLAAFVWENRLVAEASVTRQLILGAVLVVMMIARPHGLLGTPRVESL